MTPNEKHALIEKELFGRVWTPDPHPYFEGNWLRDGEHLGGAEWDVTHEPPNYSRRVDLCVDAEAKIAAMDRDDVWWYVDYLYQQMPKHTVSPYKDLWLISASAEVRVEAMVRMLLRD
jgi:hypothetical protein